MRPWILLLLALGGSRPLSGQVIDTVLLDEQAFVHHPFVYSTFSSLMDRSGLPFLYTANVEYGLRVYDITDATSPIEVEAAWPPVFGGLKPTGLHQEGSLLYVALGGFQGSTQPAGLAVLDVTDPADPVILDQWDSSAFSTGSAIVRVRNGYAFLGAMEHGLVILDVSDPSAIDFVSAYLPDTVWPGIVNYAPNARGMALRGDTLFLCFDAGCLRAIDVSDKSAPVEIGHYVNPQQPANTAVAYNNAVLVGDHLFVATDFCGFEVVDVSDPANMTQVAWVNPWSCLGLSWFGSDGHSNELVTAMHDSLLFISGGDSEVLIYDITTPAQPALVGGFIHPNDSAVAWGLDVHGDRLLLNYIDNSLVLWPPQPYYADDGGFQLFTWQTELSTEVLGTAETDRTIRVWPNPTTGPLNVAVDGPSQVVVRDLLGRERWRGGLLGPVARIDLVSLEQGSYVVEVAAGGGTRLARVVIQP